MCVCTSHPTLRARYGFIVLHPIEFMFAALHCVTLVFHIVHYVANWPRIRCHGSFAVCSTHTSIHNAGIQRQCKRTVDIHCRARSVHLPSYVALSVYTHHAYSYTYTYTHEHSTNYSVLILPWSQLIVLCVTIAQLLIRLPLLLILRSCWFNPQVKSMS